MALTFTGTLPEVSHGSAASLDDLDPFTWVFVHKPGTLDGTNFRMLGSKSGGGNIFALCDGAFGFGLTAGMRLTVPYSTTSCDYWTAGSVFTVGNWYFSAYVFDASAGAGNQVKFYNALVGGAVAEVASVNTTNLSGSRSSDAANSFRVGNYDGASEFRSDGDIAVAAVYNTALGLGDLKKLAYAPLSRWNTAACVLLANYHGTGTQIDRSGTGNDGTVSVATAANHAPLVSPWGVIGSAQPGALAAASGRIMSSLTGAGGLAGPGGLAGHGGGLAA